MLGANFDSDAINYPESTGKLQPRINKVNLPRSWPQQHGARNPPKFRRFFGHRWREFPSFFALLG